jgi:hypothetical protein
MAGYARAIRGKRVRALKGITFLRTWCKDKGKGIATTIPPTHLKGKEERKVLVEVETSIR